MMSSPLYIFPMVNDSANLDPWTHGKLNSQHWWQWAVAGSPLILVGCATSAPALSQPVRLLDTLICKAASSNCCTNGALKPLEGLGCCSVVECLLSTPDDPGCALQHQKQNTVTPQHSDALLNDKLSWFYPCGSMGATLTQAKVLKSLDETNHIWIFHWPKCCHARQVHSMSASETARPPV